MTDPSALGQRLAIGRLLPPGPPATAQEIVEELAREWRSAQAVSAGERPRVLLNMVSSLDGRATIGGHSGPIGGRADRELFHALRTAVDAVIVGSATARAERYRRLVREDSARAVRRKRGLADEPLACIVSGRLAFSAQDIPFLGDPQARVAILTASQASLGAHEAREGAHIEAQGARIEAHIEYIRAARAGRLDLASALAQLRERLAVSTLLCEGGPHLNTQLLAAGLVDELFLSLAPKLAGGDASGEALRILAGMDLDPPVELELLGALEHESHLFLRYGVRRMRDARAPAENAPAPPAG
jgi:riboflavin biosynthesis pyrimidine reductase